MQGRQGNNAVKKNVMNMKIQDNYIARQIFQMPQLPSD